MNNAHTIFGALRPPALRWGAPVAAFLATAAVLAVANHEPQADSAAELGPAVSAAGLGPATARSIAHLERAVEAEPDSATAYTALGDAYLQGNRETADAAFLDRAEAAYSAAESRDPENAVATIGEATVALAHHRFADGLALANEAHRLEPALVRPYALITDAQIELGRYGAAGRTLERMVRLKPTLAAYARVSYYRELNGDLSGAVQAMRLAASAGGGSVESSAYVEHLLGKLEVRRGNFARAERDFERALSVDPGYAPAIAGVARVAVARGDFKASITGYREAVARLPNTENAAALADALLAAGRHGAAERAYDRAIAIARRDPVEVNQELAMLEADHGAPARALAAAQEAWRKAPGLKSAEALGWALHRTGKSERGLVFARRALELGRSDPSLLYRFARVAIGAGHPEQARSALQRALTINPRFHPVEAPIAQRLLAEVRVH
jgi:tetratricopeptide (TPR) repeat protein